MLSVSLFSFCFVFCVYSLLYGNQYYPSYCAVSDLQPRQFLLFEGCLIFNHTTLFILHVVLQYENNMLLIQQCIGNIYFKEHIILQISFSLINTCNSKCLVKRIICPYTKNHTFLLRNNKNNS